MNILLNKSYEAIKKIFLEHMALEKANMVLDIGCGRRGNFCRLPANIYVGIDQSDKIIKKLRKRTDGKYCLADARILEFDEASIDYIISVSFFHHLSDEEVGKISKTMKKILKKNGRVIIADGVYPDSKLNLPGRLIRFFDLGRHVRSSADFRKMFLNEFYVEREYNFTDKIFSYSVLVMSAK